MAYDTLSTVQRDAILTGTFEYIANAGKKLFRQNDDKRPLLEKVFMPIMTSKHTFRDGEISIMAARKSEADASSPYGTDTLTYTPENQGEKLTYNEGRIWLGLQEVDDVFRGMGYKVKMFAPGMTGVSVPKNKRITIIQELAEKVFARQERYREILDEALHSDGTGTPDIMGIRGLFPVTNTAGTIGGISRAIEAYQHQVVTGLSAGTYGSPGDLRSLLDPAIRQANRFAMKGKLSVAVAGSTAIDTLKAFSENRGQWNGELSGVTKVDPSISDAAVYYGGIPIHYDPTLDNLADSEGDATLKKSIYFFNPQLMELAHDEHMERATPPAEYNQMISREGLFGRYSVLVYQPNSACLLAQVD